MPPSRLPPWQRAHDTAYWALPRSACAAENTPSHTVRSGACPTTLTIVPAHSAPARMSARTETAIRIRGYFSVQVKLAAAFSEPAAPVNFGHFGYSHIGRDRFAFGLPS